MTPAEQSAKFRKQATIEVFVHVAIAFASLFLLYILQRYILKDMLGNFIVENPKVYCLILWVTFIMSAVVSEAILFKYENESADKNDINEHLYFVVTRLCMWIPLWILTDWKCALSFALIFFFIHDGQYYRWRDILKPGTYPKRWFDWSKTSTAFWTKYMPAPVRIATFIGGITLYILTF